MSQSKLNRARDLIKQKKLIEARNILLTIPDDPTAREWLPKLEAKIKESFAPTVEQEFPIKPGAVSPRRRYGCFTWGVFIFGGLLILYVIMPASMRPALPTRVPTKPPATSAAETSNGAGLRRAEPTLTITDTLSPMPSFTTPAAQSNSAADGNAPTPDYTAIFALIPDDIQSRPTTAPNLPPPVATSTATSDQAQTRDLIDTVMALAGGRNIYSIQITDGRANGGERSVFITYLTTESTEAGFVDEWIDLLEAVAHSLDFDDVDADTVALLMGSPSGVTLGLLSISAADTVAYYRGEMSRAAFILKLEFVSM